MDTVLITGGAGFVGSHCCKAFAAAGLTPITYDDLSRGKKQLVRWGPLEVGDIRDVTRLGEVFSKYSPVAVIHCAALAYVGESVEKPVDYYSVNVGGTINLLETMLSHSVQYLIFSSSCAIYGIPTKVPIFEDEMQVPINPYGHSKLMGEQIIKDAANAKRLRYIGLRFFNVSGCDPDREIGEIHEPETHIIPRALMVAKGDLPFLEILGDDYDTPDGTCIRDYIHVSDLAEFHLKAMMKLKDEKLNACVNLGTGHGYSVKEVIQTAEKITGRKIRVKVRERRPGDPAILVSDPARAHALFGNLFKRSDLSTIIETQWSWIRSNS